MVVVAAMVLVTIAVLVTGWYLVTVTLCGIGNVRLSVMTVTVSTHDV